MIEGLSPIYQALLGTLFTWGVTAAGSGLVFIWSSGERRLLDGSLGFAAGVMLAASYWSLLAPAIEMAEVSGKYGSYAFIPVAVGFIVGAIFVFGADLLLSVLGVSGDPLSLIESKNAISNNLLDDNFRQLEQKSFKILNEPQKVRLRRSDQPIQTSEAPYTEPLPATPEQTTNWKRILLLIVAITVHNIPEGLAVGVGFGAVGKTASATFENARNLAIGIGIQNFPEGLAVSFPLRAAGMSVWKSFWYGQLSGMVEPIAGVFGAVAIVVAQPLLPYALAFAAGAMVYVVVNDIIPEANAEGNGKLASFGAILGFVVMMSLDVGLG